MENTKKILLRDAYQVITASMYVLLLATCHEDTELRNLVRQDLKDARADVDNTKQYDIIPDLVYVSSVHIFHYGTCLLNALKENNLTKDNDSLVSELDYYVSEMNKVVNPKEGSDEADFESNFDPDYIVLYDLTGGHHSFGKTIRFLHKKLHELAESKSED